jgi:hypothetical protein
MFIGGVFDKSYASGLLYTPSGSITQINPGNGLRESISHNSRLQPLTIESLLRYTQNLSSADSLRTGDIIRYGNDEERGGTTVRNAPQHFMNVLYTGDDGITQTFSRTGVNGKFEIVPSGKFAGTNYGQIQGRPNSNDKTGFYRP